MISKKPKLSIVVQCGLLSLSTSSYYYHGKGISDKDLRIMHCLDKLHLELPSYGSRRLRDELEDASVFIGRDHVRRLMREMGIEAIYPRSRTTQPGRGHKIYPYLLRNLSIERANQVWATDITYIPMRRGFLYLVAIMDWHSRKVLSYRFSNTLDTQFCLDALEDALAQYGAPEIFNTDQGSQFTSNAFTERLKDAGIQISMDGKGAWVDNVFIERLWRSLKYDEVYLKAYEDVNEAKASIKAWFKHYNQKRRHYGLNRKTPDQIYLASTQPRLAA